MITKLLDFYFHRRKAQTLVKALKSRFSAKIINTASRQVSHANLIEYLEKEYPDQAENLLQLTAQRMNLQTIDKLSLPPLKLLRRVGYDPLKLEKSYAIPQPSSKNSSGYSLAIADPDLIDLSAFEQANIELILCRGSEIIECWRNFHQQGPSSTQRTLSELQVANALKNIIVESISLGGKEVFLGHPDSTHYEFFAKGNLYTGTIHPLLFNWILLKLRNVTSLNFPITDSQIKSIKLSLTKNFERPVIFLGWDMLNKPTLEKQLISSPSLLTASQPIESRTIKKSQPIEILNSLQQFKALLIDDDRRFLLILRKILESKNWQVESDISAVSALDSLKSGLIKPDLIISDVHMPEMDGSVFLKSIRGFITDLPVLMLTSDQDQILEAELALLGADAFIRKHEDPRILLAWCNSLARRYRKRAENHDSSSVKLAANN